MMRGDYETRREGAWTFLARPERWSAPLWEKVREILKSEAPARHPRVKRFRFHEAQGEEQFYLKTYYCLGPVEKVKSLFRDSKAFRALKQGAVLRREGFQVPEVVAAGEERRYRLLKRAFMLTVGVDGMSLPVFLKENFSAAPTLSRRSDKRAYMRQLAAEVARLHERGFVHGDLIPHNILVRRESRGVSFFFLDNDRTRRYPQWLPHGLWKRNLVQLNRVQLPGIFLQDRLRFLQHYLGDRNRRPNDRALIAWLEKSTRRRRARRDRLRGNVSLRALLKWDGRVPKKNKVDTWPA